MSDSEERRPTAHETTILRVGTVLAHALGAMTALVLVGTYLSVTADRVAPAWVLASVIAALMLVAALSTDVMRHSVRPEAAPWLPVAVLGAIAAVAFS